MTNTLLVALFGYLVRGGGEALVDQVVAAASTGTSRELEDRAWAGRNEVVAIAEAAASLTGDPDIGRRAGEELFRLNLGDGETRDLLVATGDPASALEAVFQYAMRLGRGRTYTIVGRAPDHLVVECVSQTRSTAHPFFCGLNLGYWSAVPGLFGSVGVVLHPRCECRGDDRCVFVVRWDHPGPGAAATPVSLGEATANRVVAQEGYVSRLETFDWLQGVGEDLARAPDLESLAERLLDSVDRVAPAPGLLVAIRVPGDDDHVITASRGLARDQAVELAADLIGDRHDGAGGVTQVKLGKFGIIATVAPESVSVPVSYARHLRSFAGHAASWVEAVASRQQAERGQETFQSLLSLAETLAAAMTEQAVCECLAEAVPRLVGADHSSVLLWDADSSSLTPVAYVGDRDPVMPSFGTMQFPDLAHLASHPAPILLERTKVPAPVAEAMEGWGDEADILVPLIRDGAFYGLVCAGYRQGPVRMRNEAFARLKGVADLAAPAFAKVGVLEEVRHRAQHDVLTGLPNRTLLESRVDLAMSDVDRNGGRMGLLFVDLDHFKTVNDSLGHETGDRLLQAASARIRDALRSTDTLARVGGDEFVVVAPGITDASEADAVAERVLEHLNRPLTVADRRFQLSASIGIAVYPDDGADYRSLLQKADGAMYRSKDQARGTFTRVSAVPRRRSEDRSTADGPGAGGYHDPPPPPEDAGGSALASALDRAEITAYFQPHVRLADLGLAGVEALARWAHPERGLLAPADFFAAAEAHGILTRIDRRVRRITFRQASIWRGAATPVRVVVNLSVASLRRGGVAAEVVDDVRDFRLDPSAVELDVPPAALEIGAARRNFRDLATAGFSMAVDGLPCEVDALEQVAGLPVKTVKVSGRRPELPDLARKAHAAGVAVLVSGIETDADLEWLRSGDFDLGQGYALGRPMPVDALERVLLAPVVAVPPVAAVEPCPGPVG